MKTVPTLCATATCIGASAVGLSFGRENPLDNSNKKRPAPARELHLRPMSTTVQSTTTTATNTAAAATTTLPSYIGERPPPSSSSSSRVPTTARYSYDCRPQRPIVKGTTSADPSVRPHSVMENCSTAYEEPAPDAIDPDLTNRAPTRRTSWIKRLSNISNSQPSSRNSSPGPLSPSLSLSNGSMAFSHDGSTAPMVGKRSPSPLPPNKLVKRSSSVQVPRASTSHGSGSRLPSLRRPATSHQRSATLQHQSALMELATENASADGQSRPVGNENGIPFIQYFTAKVAKEKTLSKRRGSVAASKNFKRISPDEKHVPTLVSARAVAAASADEVDDTSSEDGESVYFISRPATPSSMTAAIPANPDARDAQEKDAPRGRPAMTDAEETTRPRRSLSITDFIPSGLGVKMQRGARLPGVKLSRKPSQRVRSAPLPSMGNRPGNTAHGEPATTISRQDLTDPALRRENPTSTGSTEAVNSQNGFCGVSSASVTSPALPSHRPVAMTDSVPALLHENNGRPAALAAANQMPPSPNLGLTAGHPSRNSAAPSEQASTLIGSDNEARGMGSGDEDDADLQSETVFDSLRTRATRSTSGARGPSIETIFDESPPSKVKVTALRDLLPKGTFQEQAADGGPGHQSIAEEEESISTPVRTIIAERSINGSPGLSRGQNAPYFPNLMASSPPDMPKPLSLGTLEWDSKAEDDDSSRWSVDEQDDESWGDFPVQPPATLLATPMALGRHTTRQLASGSSPKPSTPQHLVIEHPDRDARSSIFDWSEQQHADKSSGNRTPPRPSTVHGKKDADRRGSRAVGRRVPSGLHARSQSVPVVPDATGKRSTVVTNKFGTWGVGSKGVTEDWNDDFDFSDLNEESPDGTTQSHRVDSGSAMVVPKTIQEQQSNVLANIGLLREWGLLIEELKEQRVRAAALGLLDNPNVGVWEEVDAMIDLADQEADHDGVPRLSPPSSPGFDEDVFDEVPGPSPSHGQIQRKSGGLARETLGKNHTLPAMPVAQSNQPKRKSILPPNNDIFGPQSSPIPPKPQYEPRTTSPSTKCIVTRPRKDSEAKARSVIEALQKRKSIHDPGCDDNQTPASKVPFDTATLRRIVPYVSTLTRKVKEALRDAEGLYSSPAASPAELPFSKMFQAEDDLQARMKLMTVM